ncbi:MAG: restriction endonuclease subunit S [Bacteroidia bacterium]
MLSSISDIATIQTGIFPKTVQKGDAILLQVKHFNALGQVSSFLQPEVLWSKNYHKHLLNPGDIIFAAKGSNNFAAVVDYNNTLCVASTSFLVLKLKDKRIYPPYISWYLNNPDTLGSIKAMSRGTKIPSISKKDLAEIKIPIPNLETQKKIVELFNLRIKEKQLKLQIEKLRDVIFQHQLMSKT